MPKITIKDLPDGEVTPHVNWLTSCAFRPTPPIADDGEFLDILTPAIRLPSKTPNQWPAPEQGR